MLLRHDVILTPLPDNSCRRSDNGRHKWTSFVNVGIFNPRFKSDNLISLHLRGHLNLRSRLRRECTTCPSMFTRFVSSYVPIPVSSDHPAATQLTDSWLTARNTIMRTRNAFRWVSLSDDRKMNPSWSCNLHFMLRRLPLALIWTHHLLQLNGSRR